MDCIPCYFPTMHQGSGNGPTASLGVHAWLHLHGLQLTLSPFTHPCSLPRCVLSWMSRMQSRFTVPTGQHPHPCDRRGYSIPPSPMLSVELGSGQWVGGISSLSWCTLPWVFAAVS